MTKTNIKKDWIDNHLYFSPKFSNWINKTRGLSKVSELQQLTVAELLEADDMTLHRLKRILIFMAENKLKLKSY